ncbi:MAG: FtsB family cell division protein [Flavobacteriaceae bacterium]
MFLKKLQEHKYFKHILNPYIAITIAFVVWMLFFDDNSYLFHRELDSVINEKQAEIELYQTEIEKDKKSIQVLNNDENLENFARKEYYMKKDNEEIYIIEYENKPTKHKTDE